MTLETKTCPVCGIIYAAPSAFFKARHENKNVGSSNGWHCPNGHYLVFKESLADKIARERDMLKRQLAQKDDEIAGWKREKEKAEKETRRVKKRATAGVCQCCNRTFSNVARHMATKHPNVKPKLVAEKVS